MKKSFILIIILISLFIVGCDIDPYKGMRPSDYENSVWESSDPYMYIEYGIKGEEIEGLLFEDQDQIKISLLYSALDNQVTILNDQNENMINFTAKYGRKTCVLTVTYVYVDIDIEFEQIILKRTK